MTYEEFVSELLARLPHTEQAVTKLATDDLQEVIALFSEVQWMLELELRQREEQTTC